MKKLAILGYHKVGAPPPNSWDTWNYVSAEIFESQLQYLKDDGWKVMDDKQFLTSLDNPATLPEKAALITFDDGYQSNLYIALPLLQKFSFPAVVFVPTAFVASYNAFDADIFYEPKEPICSWKELLELEKNLLSVQSHGVTHRHFSHLPEETQKAEIFQSKELIESKLGKQVTIFSFPYGDNGGDDQNITAFLTQAGYKAAVLYGGGPVDLETLSPFRLPRIAVGADTCLQAELHKLSLNIR